MRNLKGESMAEKRLSEELRHCLDGNGCADCTCYEQKSVLTCKDLLQKAYEVVNRYEEMEGQGKFIKLPFTTGDEVWVVDENKTFRCKVINIEICNQRAFAVVEKNMMYEENMGYIRVPMVNFCKTVFLTKEAAEKALKEMEDRKNGEID